MDPTASGGAPHYPTTPPEKDSMKREAKIEGLKRRVRAWLFFIVCGLAVLLFGSFLDDAAPGMGDSIISLGFIWIGASVLLLIVNLYVLQVEKKKLIKEESEKEQV